MKLICKECGASPLFGRALFRDKGALFHGGKSIKGVGPLFCASCAPAKIRKAIVECVRLDHETKALAGGWND